MDNKELEDVAYSKAVDVWAVGILAFELMVGKVWIWPGCGRVGAGNLARWLAKLGCGCWGVKTCV